MLKIGFLVFKIVENSCPADEWDVMRVEYKVVYSWEDLENFADRPYSRESFRLIRMLYQNKPLIHAIKNFRKKFNLPAEGVDFVKNKEIIRNKQFGTHKPIWCYENLLPENSRPKAKKYIENFIAEHNISAPLKYQMDNLFYCGFVDVRINDAWIPISIYIPDKEDIECRGLGYRLPVSIRLNSANLTKKEVKQFIDKHWENIKTYFKQYPAIMDVSFSEQEEVVAAYKDQGLTYPEILEKISPAASEGASGSTEQIAEQHYRIRKKASKIITPKKPKNITKK